MRQLIRRSQSILLLPFIAALALPALCSAAPEKGPIETLRQKNSQVEHLLKRNLPKDSPEDKKQQEEIKHIAAELLDYAELAKRSMAQHWDTLKPQQRDEFVTNFQGMLEKHYVKQIRNSLDYQVLYQDEQVTGQDARVKTTVKVKSNNKIIDAEIEYKMHKVGPIWMVWDIVTDEVSLVRNYKTQFHKIISEQGYDKLLEKMKSKLKEGA